MSKNPLDALAGNLGNSLGDYLREQRLTKKLSVRQLSALAGISNPYLSQIERGVKRPSAEILQQIAKGLSISAESLYVQAGLLDPKDAAAEAGHATRTAIGADPALTARQRQTLLDIYESFVEESVEQAQSGTTKGAAAPRKATKKASTKPASAKTAATQTSSATPAQKKAPAKKATKKTTASPKKAQQKKAAPSKKAAQKKTTAGTRTPSGQTAASTKGSARTSGSAKASASRTTRSTTTSSSTSTPRRST